MLDGAGAAAQPAGLLLLPTRKLKSDAATVVDAGRPVRSTMTPLRPRL